MQIQTAYFVLALVVLAPRPADAQTPPYSAADYRLAILNHTRDTRIARIALDPRAAGAAASGGDVVVLEVGKKGEAIGRARVQWNVSPRSFIDLTLEGPISGDKGTPLTDAGLANGASAKVGYSFAVWSTKFDLPSGSGPTLRGERAPSRDLESVAAFLASTSGPTTEANRSLKTLAAGTPLAAAIGQSPMNAARTLANVYSVYSAVLFKGAATIGSQSFTFADTAGAAVQTQTHRFEILSGTAAYSRIVSNGEDQWPAFLVAGTLRRSFGHNAAGAPGQYCSPVVNTATLKCSTYVVGAPNDTRSDGYEVEARVWAHRQKLGFNPKVLVDKVSDTRTVDLAVSYLVTKPAATNERPEVLNTGAITAGVRFGWQTQRGARITSTFFSVFFSTVLGLK